MKRSPPTKRQFRKRRKRAQKKWDSLPVPSEINTIKDLIIFAHTYKGDHVNVTGLRKATPALLDLDKMVGLSAAKASVIDMAMHFAQKKISSNDDYLHTMVCGPPGCGKTTFCRVLGRILAAMGVLSKNTFVTVKRIDLVGKYLGHTAHRTNDLLKKCLGGVMFIDEAYSLAPRDTDRDSFSKEAIDFLNQFLSEHKSDLCCIIAGYEKELDQTFFAMNEGLKRRFPWKFTIEKYSPAELLAIFQGMVTEAEYTLAEGAITADFFQTNAAYFEFAGGDIETFLTKCKFAHTRNTFGKAVTNEITAEDITSALAEHKKHAKKKDSGPAPGLYL